MVAQRDSSSQPVIRPQLDWPLIDGELFSIISPIWEALNNDTISTDTIRSLFEQAVRITVSCSYRIFKSRASPNWDLLVCLN